MAMTSFRFYKRNLESRNALSTTMCALILVGIWSICTVTSTPIIEDGIDFYKASGVEKIQSIPIQECIHMELQEGQYHIISPGLQEACGFYVSAEPDKQIVISFDYVDVSCSNGGLISIIDGWELQGDFFPGIKDHPKSMKERFHEFCGSHKPKKYYRSSQNVAMIQYLIPVEGEGFQITVNFIDNPAPCNVLLQEMTDVYMLRNYGQKNNCSVAAIFPSQINVISMSVGIEAKIAINEVETGTQSQCRKRGFNDYVEFIGSNGLDPTIAQSSLTLCGLNSNPRNLFLKISCGMSAVRLVSSGKFENSISVFFRRLEPEESLTADVSCDEIA